MYALQRVNPADWEQTPELVAFYDDLAKSPIAVMKRVLLSTHQSPRHTTRLHTANFPDIVKWLVF